MESRSMYSFMSGLFYSSQLFWIHQCCFEYQYSKISKLRRSLLFVVHHLWNYGLMDIYSIFGVMIWHYFIYFVVYSSFGHWDLFQLGPVSDISPSSRGFSWYCLLASLLCGSTKCSRLILYISSLDLKLAIFPRVQGSFHWRMVIITKMWALGILIFFFLHTV